MIRTEKIILKDSKLLKSLLEDSSRIYNQSLYFIRQAYFSSRESKKTKTPNYTELCGLVKNTDVFKNSILDYNVRQYVIKQTIQNWKSWIAALNEYKKHPKKFKACPKMPKYFKNGKLNLLSIDSSRLAGTSKLKNAFCIPKTKYKITYPEYIKLDKIRNVRILRYYNKYKCEIIYDKEIENATKLNENNFIGIDLGVNNICSITTNNQNKSWIIKGGRIKSINQYFNKKKAQMQSILDIANKKQYISKKINSLYMKRKNKLDYEFHKIASIIIQLCIENNIGNIVIGHNNNWKQNVNNGKKNNQKFVQIPFNQLISILKYKCEENCIKFNLVEESYTSKCDHLLLEEMKHHETYLGKRVKRGLFKSSYGKLLNADINGAIGILRKINAISDEELFFLRNRGDVVSPIVLKY